MQTPPHFDNLRYLSLPLIQAYHDDLLVHDLAAITKYPTCPFLHVTRDYGTYLDMLIPAEDYPADGVKIPYLFGHADRWHILKHIGSSREYAEKHHPGALLLHFDGKTLREISHDFGRRVVADYQAGIRSAWFPSARCQAA